MHAVVEVPGLATHPRSRPAVDTSRKNETFRPDATERNERNDALRHAVDVDRVGAVGEIARRSVRAKEVATIELQPAPDMQIESSRIRVAPDRVQRTEVVAAVKVVDPLLRRRLAVPP